MQKIVVMSVGGSLINPGTIQLDFLKQLKTFVDTQTCKFIIVCGGGKNAREYPAVAKTFGVAGESLDEIGIRATLLNAELVRAIFHAPPVQQKPAKLTFKKVLVAAGWKPGCSTDYDAVLWAQKYGEQTVINLTNTDYIYTKNPTEKGAEPLPALSWKDYRKLISHRWSPGLHTPFDPIASQEAERSHIRVICINGQKLGELAHLMHGKPFIGTVIA